MDDKTMIQQIQRGQTKYLDDIAEKYYDDIYRFCYYRTGLANDSYDLAQETFLRFIKYVDHYKYRNLKGYLLTIARNVCVDFMKKRETLLPLDERFQDEAAVPDHQLELIEKQLLMTALWQLPDFQREAIILYYYERLKLKEVAAVMGVGVSTIKSRIRQGTGKLKKLMKEWEDE